MTLIEEQFKAEQSGRAYALATIVDTAGSTSRKAGSKMIVYADGSISGSVGGSLHEQAVIADALDCIRTGSSLIKTYEISAVHQADAAPSSITVFIECGTLPPHLVLIGAGHVGGAVLTLAKFLGYSVTLMDDRDPALFADRVKEADAFFPITDYAEDIAALKVPDTADYIVCGWGHEQDRMALTAVLKRPSYGYVGMLGGKHKIRSFIDRMRADGITQEQLDSIHTPIGLEIGSQTPQEIAISIMAEVIAYKNLPREKGK